MVDIVHEPTDDEQAKMHIWPPADFCDIGSEYAVPIHPIFEPCLLNANAARHHICQFLSTLTWIIVD